MTHKLGKELTFGLIYIEDWSIFSLSNPLFYDLPTQTDPFYINQLWYLSFSSPVKSLLIFLRAASSADFSYPCKSFKLHSHLKALCSRESPCPVTPKKHTLSSAFQETPLNLSLGASTLQCSSYRALKLIFSFLLLSIKGWHLLWKCPIHLFMLMLAGPGIGVIFSCISPRFLFSIMRQYTGFFSDRPYFVKEKAPLLEKNGRRITSEMAGADS